MEIHAFLVEGYTTRYLIITLNLETSYLDVTVLTWRYLFHD